MVSRFAGIRGVSWQTLLLIVAINTGIAAVLWIDDPRPFWHPLITAQLFGLSIAYASTRPSHGTAAAHPAPDAPPSRSARASASACSSSIKGRDPASCTRGPSCPHRRASSRWTAFSGFTNGLFVSLFFWSSSARRVPQARSLKAEAERHLLSKQAIEAELKLMQAQVEPHFLFNTLASVQYLTETDPRKAGQMLGHLIEYLRAALPQLRSGTTTLGTGSRPRGRLS